MTGVPGLAGWVLLGAAGLLGAILLWGVVSPRSQWRVLVGWSTSDPDRAEPGDAVHGVTRLVCLLGLLGLAAFGGVQLWGAIAGQAREGAPPTAMEQMWGSPAPRLLDRVVTPQFSPPADYAAGAITAYQEIERGWAPDYLVDVPRWAFLGDPEPLGILGAYPGDEYTGYGISDILVAAEGPLGCIPHIAVVAETETQVAVGIYWGLAGAAAQDHLAGCTMEGSLHQTVLIPIQLTGAVNGRTVTTIEGVVIAPAEEPEA